MEVLVLGSLVIRSDGDQLVLAARKERALVTALALHAGETVLADRLVTLLWGEDSPPSSRQTLRSLVSRVRRTLGPGSVPAEAGGAGYRLGVDHDRVDLTRFARLRATAREAVARDESERAERLLEEALALWRGTPLADLLDGPAVAGERARLEEMRLVDQELRLDVALRRARHREVVGDLRALVAENPLRERLWAQLIVALYRDERQGDALQAYQQARAVLVDELGVEPGTELRELERAVLAQAPVRTAHESAVLAAVPPQRHGPAPERAHEERPVAASPPAARRSSHDLAVPASTFVGRRSELVELAEAVRRCRLVTLVGPGGVGKTRLAVHTAVHMLPEFPDGVWLVDLSAVQTPEAVLDVVAGRLGLSLPASTRPPLGAFAEQVGQRRLLVVLDNCEHVRAAAAAAAAALLQGPNVHVLATSRELLAVTAEVAQPLRPLGLEDAARLFRDRAGAGSSPLAADDPTVAELCRRLDGLPLAVELAAGSAALRTPRELLDLLEQGWLPGRARRDVPPRHRSLRTVAEDSYRIIPPPAQRLFRRLGIFAGHVDWATVAEVCGADDTDLEDHLTTLVEASLVVAEPLGGQMRYRLLDTLRTYARGWLGDSPVEQAETERQHGLWAARLVAEADAGLRSPGELRWYERLDHDFDEIRAAYERARERDDVELGLALVAPLQHYAVFRVRPELFRLATEAVASPSVSGELAARAHSLAGWGAFAALDCERSLRHCERALALGSSAYTVVVTSSTRAAAVAMAGDQAKGRHLFAESVDAARRSGDPYWVPFLVGFGLATRAAGLDLGAEVFLDEALAVAAEVEVASLRSFLAVGQGYASLGADANAARWHLRRGVDLARAAGCTYLADYGRAGLGALGGGHDEPDLVDLTSRARAWCGDGDGLQALVNLLNVSDGLETVGRPADARRLREQILEQLDRRSGRDTGAVLELVRVAEELTGTR